jgi:hypothetical protein
MRLLSRVLVTLVICLLAIALPAMPAQAICVPWDIELSPSSGPPGTEVEVYGHDFAEGKYVDIYYNGNLVDEGMETDSSGDFIITFTIPEGCRGHYEVEADVGYSTAHTYFTVKPGLTISPEKGPVGTMVAVEGQGFAKNEESIELMYYLNGSYETIERNIAANAKGSWETSFQIPPSTRGEHELDAEGAESKLYEVQDAIFRVTAEISIDKSSGIVGDTITMTGNRFAADEMDIQILFAGQAVFTEIQANSEGDWKASFDVPEMPTGRYIVTAEGEQTEKEDLSELNFEIKPHIGLSAYEGYIGMNLTVTGIGFAANEGVTITYDDSQIATAETNDQGSFDVSFLVPESPYGEHKVTAGYSGQNAASTIFIMESDPPDTPQLISPPDKGRLGIRGKVTPTFEWSDAPDESGVHYNLQIATSEEVTAAGEFVDPMILVTGLVETSHTLETTLSYGTYYWIVQAVDGADNESGWTAVYTFRIGLLPLWGFIAAIAGAVVLLGALIRALVIRRTIYYDRW